MRPLLLFADSNFAVQDFTAHGDPDPVTAILADDIELSTVIEAMAGDDDLIANVCRTALLEPLTDPTAVRYRQDAVRDSLGHPDVVHDLYRLATDTITAEKGFYYGLLSRSPDAVLSRSVHVLAMFFDALTALRDRAEQHAGQFASAAYDTLFATLRRELDNAYLDEIRHHLNTMEFKHGVLISAELGVGNKGSHYMLREPLRDERNWLHRVGTLGLHPHTVTVPDRDQAGMSAVSDLRDRGINLVANALAQATDHILAFFRALQTELAFYLGCINLQRRLLPSRTCLPDLDVTTPMVRAKGLYDISLRLTTTATVVPNDVDARGKHTIVITGANQGGKSTLLRSIGQAYVMAQAGMFAAAEQLTIDLPTAVFTHFKREEDTTMSSGKFDEELHRMSQIADRAHPGALVLFNESFASTNEREGSEIARQILGALRDAGIGTVVVTHFYDLAVSLFDRHDPSMLFLRAERADDGSRNFQVTPGVPLPTSFGDDLYREVFGSQTVEPVSAPPGGRHAARPN